jgi:hypothetical protein
MPYPVGICEYLVSPRDVNLLEMDKRHQKEGAVMEQ